MKKSIYLLILFCFRVASAHLNPPQVISLVPPGHNLENENQIETLCPSSSKNQAQCKREKLAPKTWKLNVYENPDFKSKKVGEIHVVGTPGKGMKAQFILGQTAPVDFPSDSTETDWGYSCFFEFTASDVKGDWIQLPKRPFLNPVWINLKKEWGDNKTDTPAPFAMEVSNIYTVPSIGNIVPIKFVGKDIIYRMENKNDMSCGEEPQVIPPGELKELKMPISNLFDKDGHLIAWPAYCRGC